MSLQLGRNIALPNDAITETFGILAARGAGKSNTAAVMAEAMYDEHLPFVVVDPVGSWWGLRSSKNGTGAGLKITLFGGKRGDVPLERTGGNLVADLVVDERLSCILDLTGFDSEADKKRFLLDFARRLYKRNEYPLHMFLEEADDYIPQRPMSRGENALEPQVLRAFENIVRRGRARGLGMTMITQRSASINKNVLTQVQTLIAMRTTGPQDRKAIEDWVKYNNESLDILSTLSKLSTGEAWIWSPVFLQDTKRVKFRRRRTFDSGATPKMAAKSRTAKLANIDVSKLRKQMSDTIARAAEEDPKLLRARIKELEKLVKKKQPQAEDPQLRAELEMARSHNITLVDELEDVRQFVASVNVKMTEAVTLLGGKEIIVPALPRQYKPMPIKTPLPEPPLGAPIIAPNPGMLAKGESVVLTAIAQHAAGVDRDQLTILTGYKQSTRNLYLQKLKAAGLIDVGPPIRATTLGLKSLPADFVPLPTGDELREHWLSSLPRGERTILSALINSHPATLTREQLSNMTDYKSSTRNLYIQKLKSRKLIVQSGSGLAAHGQLYD